MSSFIKFSSLYRDAMDDSLDKFNNAYQEKLNQIFIGTEVNLTVSQSDGFNYDRNITGVVKKVHLKFSRPDIDVPLLMCHFDIEGVDQFGASYNATLKEKDLLGKIPWDLFQNFESIELIFT
jgi:hypothetical protein